MGMTIDESLEWLISRKEHYEMDDNCQELAKALDTAIDTMRKYQKIEQIVKSWNDMNSFDSMVQISEVLEDGNDENALVGCIGCKYSGVSKHAVCNSCINMNRYEQEVLEDENNT